MEILNLAAQQSVIGGALDDTGMYIIIAMLSGPAVIMTASACLFHDCYENPTYGVFAGAYGAFLGFLTLDYLAKG